MKSTVSIKFAVPEDVASQILSKFLVGRHNWGYFLSQYGNKIRSADILSFDVKSDDQSIYKSNSYGQSLRKKKTHLKTRSGMAACGISKYPSLKMSRTIGQIDCSACRKALSYREALELRPIKDMISVLRRLG